MINVVMKHPTCACEVFILEFIVLHAFPAYRRFSFTSHVHPLAFTSHITSGIYIVQLIYALWWRNLVNCPLSSMWPVVCLHRIHFCHYQYYGPNEIQEDLSAKRLFHCHDNRSWKGTLDIHQCTYGHWSVKTIHFISVKCWFPHI